MTKRSLPWLAEHVRPRARHVVYVPGNHDFYGTRLPDEIARGRGRRGRCRRHPYGRRAIPDRGGRARGRRDALDRLRRRRAALVARLGHAGGGRSRARHEGSSPDPDPRPAWLPAPFRPPAAAALHVEHRSRIERALAEPHAGPTIVVTHHAPHPLSLLAGEATGPGDAAYASDLSAIMEGPHAPDIWIHGHLHRSVDYRVGRTRVLSNARGHDTSHRARDGTWRDERENPAFDPDSSWRSEDARAHHPRRPHRRRAGPGTVGARGHTV